MISFILLSCIIFKSDNCSCSKCWKSDSYRATIQKNNREKEQRANKKMYLSQYLLLYLPQKLFNFFGVLIIFSSTLFDVNKKQQKY